MSKTAKTQKSPTGSSTLTQLYLFSYNAIQIIGWLYVLYKVIYFYLNGSDNSLWDTVKDSLIFFQSAACLEIIHIHLGFVRASIFATVMQVFSRVFVVWIVLVSAPLSRESIGLPLLLIAWSITEIIRYSFYAMSILGAVPYFISWCRYTFFYVLYPTGVTGELLVMYCSISHHEKNPFLSFQLPNALNFAFYLPYFIYTIMILYAPGLPFLYHHMIKQRQKFIGSTSKPTKKTT